MLFDINFDSVKVEEDKIQLYRHTSTFDTFHGTGIKGLPRVECSVKH